MPNLWKQERNAQTTALPFDYQQNGHNFSIILQLLLKLRISACKAKQANLAQDLPLSEFMNLRSTWFPDFIQAWMWCFRNRIWSHPQVKEM